MELQQDYVDEMAKMERPIPGQSLTNDPNQPFPFEGKPEYTSPRDACEYIFSTLIEQEVYIPVMRALGGGTPLMDVTQAILFKGFSEGKWNPDLLMMLAEPTAYMLMALAERADIDFMVYRGEIEDDEETEELLGIKYSNEMMDELRRAKKQKKIPEGVFPEGLDIEAKIEEVEVPEDSLLQQVGGGEAEEPEPEPGDSLMARPMEEE